MSSKSADARNRAYGEYFDRLLEKLKIEIPEYTNLQKAPQKNPLSIKTSMSGLTYRHRFNKENGYQIELNIETSDPVKNKDYFDSLYSQKSKIEEITGALVWDRLTGHRPCRILLSISYTTIYEVLEDPVKFEATLTWSVENAKKFKDAFTPLIRTLKAGDTKKVTLSEVGPRQESSSTTKEIVVKETIKEIYLKPCPFCDHMNEFGKRKCDKCDASI
jgi:hypothetical protein